MPLKFEEEEKWYEELSSKKIEGTLRDQIFRDGKYHDELIMGLLKMN